MCNTVAYATSFDQNCRSKSGSATVRIAFESALPIVDQSKSAYELGRLVAHAGVYKHIGLTEALLQRQFALSLNGFVDPRSRQACGKPIIEMRLRYDPLRIYLASELDDNECAQEEVLDHELELSPDQVDHAARGGRGVDPGSWAKDRLPTGGRRAPARAAARRVE